MFQKAKRLMKKLSSAKEKMQMFMLMMLCGPTAVMAQNSAGDYSAGTTALATVTEEIAKYVEKPLNFDPFGHARFAHLFVLYD